MRSRFLILLTLCLLITTVDCGSSQPPTSPVQTNTPFNVSSNLNSNTTVTEKASFDARVKNVSLYVVPGKTKDLAVSLVVSLRNLGAASGADAWTLEVNSPTAGVPTNLKPVHVNGVVDLPGSSGKSVDLAKEDLAAMLKGKPLARGSEVEGVLTFVLPETSERDLAHNSSSVILHFNDDGGSSYQTPKTYIGKKVTEPGRP